MEFLQPSLLWGALAIAIPIALHFWHQKRGKLLPWAATRWLLEKNQQAKRGLRLDQLLLLALRCLIFIVLSLLVSEPILKKGSTSEPVQKVHIVEPDAFVINNYRFELEAAQKNGDALYWLMSPLRSAEQLMHPPTQADPLTPALIQHVLNRTELMTTELHLYIKNDNRLHQLPYIRTPADFRLHAAVDSLQRPRRSYWQLAGTKRLYVDASNHLRVSTSDPAIDFTRQPVGKGPLRIGIGLTSADEQKTILAALRAFGVVYSLEMFMDEKINPDTPYEVLVTNQLPAAPSLATLYIVTGEYRMSSHPNVVVVPDLLTPQTSSQVARGQLPEWLGQRILDHIGLKGYSAPLSQAELATLFRPRHMAPGEPSARIQQALFIALLVLILLERAVALTKNA